MIGFRIKFQRYNFSRPRSSKHLRIIISKMVLLANPMTEWQDFLPRPLLLFVLWFSLSSVYLDWGELLALCDIGYGVKEQLIQIKRLKRLLILANRTIRAILKYGNVKVDPSFRTTQNYCTKLTSVRKVNIEYSLSNLSPLKFWITFFCPEVDRYCFTWFLAI